MSRPLPTLAGLLLAATLPGGAQAYDGESLYQQRCAQCHSTERMAAIVQRLGSDDLVRQRLQALLPRHHAADDAEREALIRFVLKLRPTS